MVSLLVLAHSSLAILTNFTQKVPLFDLQSPKKYSADSFYVIHESVELIDKFGHHGRWVYSQKTEIISLWISPTDFINKL